MEYFYNGQWYSYEYLHTHYGITLSPATSVTLYDLSLNEFTGWKDDDDNTWVTSRSQWFSTNNLPYYTKSDSTFTVYLVEKALPLNIYTLRDSSLYEYNDNLRSYEFLHFNNGITLTPSSVYYSSKGEIKCWYNEAIDKYWDVSTAAWYDQPLHYDDDDDHPIDIDNINKIGAMGLFLFYSPTGGKCNYGLMVRGDQLQPMCLKFPSSGEITCSKVVTQQLTGLWRLLTATAKSSPSEPCIVFAMKIADSDDNIQALQDSNILHQSATPSNVITTIEYDL